MLEKCGFMYLANEVDAEIERLQKEISEEYDRAEYWKAREEKANLDVRAYRGLAQDDADAELFVRAENNKLKRMLKELSCYVGYASCKGDKCRLPHCHDCCDEESRDEAGERLEELEVEISAITLEGS